MVLFGVAVDPATGVKEPSGFLYPERFPLAPYSARVVPAAGTPPVASVGAPVFVVERGTVDGVTPAGATGGVPPPFGRSLGVLYIGLPVDVL